MEVLVGLCDGPLDPERCPPSALTNKIGGSPDLYPGAPRLDPGCSLCGAPLVHVVQVYCPLDGSPYHRTLRLFACTRSACRGRPGSWRALRSQALETEVDRAGSRSRSLETSPVLPNPLAAKDWCDTADDWGDTEGDMEEPCGRPPPPQLDREEEVSGRLQQLSLRGPGGPAGEAPGLQDPGGPAGEAPGLQSPGGPAGEAPGLQSFYISVVEESELRPEEDLLGEHARRLLRDYEAREGVSVGAPGPQGSTSGEEQYEKSRARHGDAAFSRFMKRVSRCPQQLLRYCWAGEPLYLSDPPAHMERGVPACGGCGGPRTFEFQLMPALVSLLRPGASGGPAADPPVPLEFGTVLVFTCRGSCWAPGSGPPVQEEFVFLQDDPDQQLFL
ncbi:hypothetical protein CRUP_016712 [Coryphaenoides rupestris]|nr:hypothetical protein CRUP_016712 [Coryphaenoides rupestris]